MQFCGITSGQKMAPENACALVSALRTNLFLEEQLVLSKFK